MSHSGRDRRSSAPNLQRGVALGGIPIEPMVPDILVLPWLKREANGDQVAVLPVTAPVRAGCHPVEVVPGQLVRMRPFPADAALTPRCDPVASADQVRAYPDGPVRVDHDPLAELDRAVAVIVRRTCEFRLRHEALR